MLKCRIANAMLSFTVIVQYNLSIPNLVYSEILFNTNKWFGPNAIYYILHIKLPCVFRILCILNSEHKNWVPRVHNCLIWHPVFRSMHVDLTQAKSPWMFIWSFNEITDLLCQGESFTVFLIIIHKLFVHVYLKADIKYLSYSNLPVHVSL